ncbi:MAG: ribosomal protein S18-alanine N-acetyltransferase [bacterium]
MLNHEIGVDQPVADPLAQHFFLRGMDVHDLDSVFELEKQNFSDGWSQKHFTQEVLGNAFSFAYVVEKEARVIAYAVYWYLKTESHLMKVAVDEKHRRGGIASYLLYHLVQEWRRLRVERAFLEVRHTNRAALQLYLKFGFKKSGIRKQYYDNMDEAILMTLSLRRDE